MNQARYATSIFSNYLDTTIIKENSKYHKTILPHDIIFTKENAFTSDEKVEVLSTDNKINYIFFVGSFIYILSARVDLYFTLHKRRKFLSNPGKVNFKGLVKLLRYMRENIFWA